MRCECVKRHAYATLANLRDDDLAGVALVEFSCTAPLLWTHLLIAQEVIAVTFGVLLLLYMLIYQIDELTLFLVAVFTLKASKLEEKQNNIMPSLGIKIGTQLASVLRS